MALRMVVAGDVVNYGSPDGRLLGPALEAHVQQADYSVFNFEAPIVGHGSPVRKVGVHHAQLESTLIGLRSQGFDLALLANNHIMDFGRDALTASLDAAARAGLDTVGAGLDQAQAYEPRVMSADGISIAMLNLCEAHHGALTDLADDTVAGYAWISHPSIELRIRDLKRTHNFVVVFAHAGLEYYPVPLTYWRQRFASFCDAGADAVIGAHPHVPQGLERRRGSVIAYSLGNLYFDSRTPAARVRDSYSLDLTFHHDGSLDVETLAHRRGERMTELVADQDSAVVARLSAMLADDRRQSAMVEEAFRACSDAVRSATGPFLLRPNPWSEAREFAKLVLSRGTRLDRDLLLQHYVRNETYRAVIDGFVDLKL